MISTSSTIRVGQANRNESQQTLSVMCQIASLPASSGLARSSAPSDTSSLLETSVVLDFYFQNAVLHGYRCASGALPLF